MTQPLSLAKLNPPRNYQAYERQRLFTLLDQAQPHPINWISAPAGSGKTTLVTSYLAARGIQPYWYQVDEGDNDMASFYYYLGQLAVRIAPLHKPLPLLTPEYQLGVPTFTRNFFRQFFGLFQSESYLVFDNFQHIAADNPLHNALSMAFEEIPKGITLIVISRGLPHTAYARLTSASNFHQLGWEDLRLTDGDYKGLAQKLYGIESLSSSQLQHLRLSSQDWITGLILLLKQENLSTSESCQTKLSGSQQVMHDSQEKIFDFFVAEIFSRLESRIQEFLYITALLPRMNVSIVRDLTGFTDTNNILESLEKQQIFISHYCGDEDYYEYHPLFRNFLLSKSEKVFSEFEILNYKNNAARLLYESGNIDAAVLLLQQSTNWEELSKIIIGSASSLTQQGRYDTLKSWLTLLPDECVKANPWLCYWSGVYLLHTNTVNAREMLEISYSGFKEAKDKSGLYLAWSTIVKTFVYEWSDFKPSLKWIDEFQYLNREYPSIEQPEVLAQVVFSVVTLYTFARPECKELSFWINTAENLLKHCHNDEQRALMINALQPYYLWVGDINKLNIVKQIAQSILDRKDVGVTSLLLTHVVNSSTTWITGEPEKAIEIANSGLQIGVDKGVYVFHMLQHAQIIFACLALRDFPQARDNLSLLEKMIPPGRQLDLAQVQYLKGMIHLFADEPKQALQFLTESYNVGRNTSFIIPSALVSAALVQTNVILGQHVEAKVCLDYLDSVSSSTSSCYLNYVSLLLHCWIEFESNSIAKANKYLDVFYQKYGCTGNAYGTALLKPEILSFVAQKALQENMTECAYFLIDNYKLVPRINSQPLETWPYHIKFYTLGRFRLVIKGEVLECSGKAQKKPLELLKLLIALGGRDVRDDQLTEVLWPDSDGDAAYDSLKTTVARLRKLLNEKNAISFVEGKISLDPRYCWVDCWSFERILGQNNPDVEHLNKAITFYHGNFLGGEADSYWFFPARERLQRKFIKAVTTLGEMYEKQQLWQVAIDVYQKGLHVDNVIEIFYQGLMRCYHAHGQQVEVSKIYQQCTEVLQTQLHIKPSVKTKLLNTKPQY